jgi:hypothetical protein
VLDFDFDFDTSVDTLQMLQGMEGAQITPQQFEDLQLQHQEEYVRANPGSSSSSSSSSAGAGAGAGEVIGLFAGPLPPAAVRDIDLGGEFVLTEEQARAWAEGSREDDFFY